MLNYRLNQEAFESSIFTKIIHVSPESESFYLSFGISLFESFLSINPSDRSQVFFKTISKEATKLTFQAIDINPRCGLSIISNINKYIQQLTKSEPKSSLSLLRSFLKENDCCLCISETIKMILIKYFFKNKDELMNCFRLKKEYLVKLCGLFKVFVWVYNFNDNLNVNHKNSVPVIHLLRSNSTDNEAYYILHHKDAENIVPSEFNDYYPFVYQNNSIQNIDIPDKYKSIKKEIIKEVENKEINEFESQKISRFLDELTIGLFINKVDVKKSYEIISLYRKCLFWNENLENFATVSQEIEEYQTYVESLTKTVDTCGHCFTHYNTPTGIDCINHKICLNCRISSEMNPKIQICSICARFLNENEKTMMKKLLGQS